MNITKNIFSLILFVSAPLAAQTISFRGSLSITPAVGNQQEVLRLAGTNIVVENRTNSLSAQLALGEWIFTIDPSNMRIESASVNPVPNQLSVKQIRGTATSPWKLVGSPREAYVLRYTLFGPSSLFTTVGLGNSMNMMPADAFLVAAGTLDAKGKGGNFNVALPAAVLFGAIITAQASMLPLVGSAYTTNLGLTTKR